MFEVKDKVVIITGGSSGIGKALCEGFNKQGAIVYNADIQNPGDVKYKWIYTDLTKKDNIDDLVNIVMNEQGIIDILVNNAGIGYGTYDEIVAVNMTAPYLLIKKVSEIMIKNNVEGSIINIGSFNTYCSMPGNPPYVSSKSGMRGLTKSFSVDLGKHNIRVNTVHPGYIETPLNRVSLADSKLYKIRKERASLNRWGKPEELVGICILLASNDSSFITGTEIYVDGGWTSKAC